MNEWLPDSLESAHEQHGWGREGEVMSSRYLVEVWMYHDIVDSHECASLAKAHEWLSKEGWLKSWAYGDCYFEVFKDGKELSFLTLYENKFYNEEEE